MRFIISTVFRMKWLNNKQIRKWLRIIHRDLGYFVVGITLVYAISGIILNHKKHSVDPAFKTIFIEKQLKNYLTIEQFKAAFNKEFNSDYQLNTIIPEQQYYQLFIKGGIGKYYTETGQLTFEVYKKKPLVFFMNKLHYNQKKYWTTPADFFGAALIFLALSGLFMVRGKNSFIKRGKWYVIAGVLLLVIYIWL